MVFDPKLFKYRRAKRVVPICVILALGYIDFACFYSLGYREIYKYHSHGVAVSLWVILGCCELSVIAYWILILTKGPGRAPCIKPFNLYDSADTSDLTPVPEYFFCDESGYPFWCSLCQSIKLPRTLHLKDKNYCILKFDHYCVWIGTVIGQDNYKYFLNFVLWLLMFFIIMLIYLLRYTKLNYDRGTRDVDHNYIVLYILCGFWILIIMSLLFVHLRYIFFNMTTIDDMNINKLRKYLRWNSHIEKRNKKNTSNTRNIPVEENGNRFINVRYKNTRIVIQYNVLDAPFSFGFRKNWQNLWLNDNRTGGISGESSYSSKRLIISFSLFIIPYINVIYPFRERKNASDQEKIQGNPYAERLVEYEQYNDRLSDEFLDLINNKIRRNDFRMPQYLTPSSETQQSSSERSKPVDI